MTFSSSTAMARPPGEGGSAPLSTPPRTRGDVERPPLDSPRERAGTWSAPRSTPPRTRGDVERPPLDSPAKVPAPSHPPSCVEEDAPFRHDVLRAEQRDGTRPYGVCFVTIRRTARGTSGRREVLRDVDDLGVLEVEPPTGQVRPRLPGFVLLDRWPVLARELLDLQLVGDLRDRRTQQDQHLLGGLP